MVDEYFESSSKIIDQKFSKIAKAQKIKIH